MNTKPPALEVDTLPIELASVRKHNQQNLEFIREKWEEKSTHRFFDSRLKSEKTNKRNTRKYLVSKVGDNLHTGNDLEVNISFLFNGEQYLLWVPKSFLK